MRHLGILGAHSVWIFPEILCRFAASSVLKGKSGEKNRPDKLIIPCIRGWIYATWLYFWDKCQHSSYTNMLWIISGFHIDAPACAPLGPCNIQSGRCDLHRNLNGKLAKWADVADYWLDPFWLGLAWGDNCDNCETLFQIEISIDTCQGLGMQPPPTW